MTYNFSQIRRINNAVPYGHLICNNHFILYENADAIGVYFINEKLDWFVLYNEENSIELYTINKWERKIVNTLTSKVVGCFQFENNNDNIEGKLILQQNIFNCFKINEQPKSVSLSSKKQHGLLLSNDEEQVYIHLFKERKKITTILYEENYGHIKTNTHNQLLLFSSLYFINEILL